MSELQRYCMQYDGFEECVIEEAYDRCAWVKFSDAEAALAEKDNEIARLKLLLSDCLDCFEDTPTLPIAVAIKKILEARDE